MPYDQDSVVLAGFFQSMQNFYTIPAGCQGFPDFFEDLFPTFFATQPFPTPGQEGLLQ